MCTCSVRINQYTIFLKAFKNSHKQNGRLNLSERILNGRNTFQSATAST